ncbi:MAG: hypothetical protein LC798_03185 [Chloroflexi bacterium]|nr:hypothetical protein [Chloroflexota bacterium]
MSATAPRYDFGPLWEAAAAPSFIELARRLGLHSRQLYRYAHRGVTDGAADRLAVRLGFVPYLLWPEWLAGEGSEAVQDWVTITAERRRQQEDEAMERRRIAKAALAERPKPVQEPKPERDRRPVPLKDDAECCNARRDADGRLPIGYCSPECIRRPGPA